MRNNQKIVEKVDKCFEVQRILKYEKVKKNVKNILKTFKNYWKTVKMVKTIEIIQITDSCAVSEYNHKSQNSFWNENVLVKPNQ